jgi:hypothetical protein
MTEPTLPDPAAVDRVLAWQRTADAERLLAERAAPALLVAEHAEQVAAALAAERGPRWRLVAEQADGQAWQRPVAGAPFTAIWSLARATDGRLWLHASASHRQRLPSWDEMAMVKRLLVGPERWACQLHPPEAAYVNLHSRVLHVWAPWDPAAWPLPDFAHTLPDGTRTL